MRSNREEGRDLGYGEGFGRAGGERGMTVHEAASILGKRGGEARGGGPRSSVDTERLHEAARVMGRRGGEARGRAREGVRSAAGEARGRRGSQ